MITCIDPIHDQLLNLIRQASSKPEPNMLKILPNIPSSTSQIITHYSYFILISLPIILYALLLQVLTSRETHGSYRLDTYIVVDNVYMTVMYIYIINKTVNKSHSLLFLNCFISYVIVSH